MSNESTLQQSPKDSRRRELGQFFRVVLVVFVLRLVMIAAAPVDLSHDEAYYWDWSRQPAWGYYSKPPMVAWLIGLSTQLGGNTAFFVRLPAAILATATMIVVYLLGRRMFDHRIGMIVTLLLTACPGSIALGFLMTIDAPLMFCWCGALWALWRMLSPETDSWKWCAIAILFTGLGLLSKQTMLGLLPLTVTFLMSGKVDRRWLARPALWTWAAGSFAFLAPVIAWNSRHGWPTVGHTREHFAASPAGVLDRVLGSLEFWATQFGVYSPITMFLFCAVGAGCLSRFPKLSREHRFLTCFSALPMCGILLLSLKQRIEPNWAAVFYPAGMLLVSSVALRMDRPWFGLTGQQWIRRSLVVGGTMAAALFLLPFLVGLLNIRGSRVDPLVRLHGWSELASELEEMRRDAEAPNEEIMIVTAGRAEVAELAFYLPDHPQIYLWRHDDVVRSQYDLWGMPEVDREKSTMVVAPTHIRPPDDLAEQCGGLHRVRDIEAQIGNGRSRRFTVYRNSPTRTIASQASSSGSSAN